MKRIYYIILALTLPVSWGHAAFSLTGTALDGATGLAAGDVGVFIVSNDASAFTSISITEGTSITATASYGSSFSTFTGTNTNTVTDLGFAIFLSSGVSTDLNVDGINTGDSFGIILYESSTATALAGDTFRVYTNAGWDVGADGAFDFTNDFTTYSGAPAFTGTVTAVPEPSVFAALAGLLALGWVMVRRRA